MDQLKYISPLKMGYHHSDPFFQQLTPTYELEKLLDPILSNIIQNEIMLQDSFTFVDEILAQYGDLYMASLDADAFSLYFLNR